MAAEFYFNGMVGVCFQPHTAPGQPVVRLFCLPAVDNFLFEYTVFVQNGISAAGISVRGQRVHKAGGQSAQTAVSQAGVRLALIYVFRVYTHIPECLFCCFVQPHIEQVGFQAASHKEFYTQIINLFCTAAVGLCHKLLLSVA